MYAGLLWWACVIFMFMACLRAWYERGDAHDHVDEHVGQQHGTHWHVDGNGERQGCLAHRRTSERLSPAQQFVVDLGNLLQNFPRLGVVGHEFADPRVLGLGDVIHLR